MFNNNKEYQALYFLYLEHFLYDFKQSSFFFGTFKKTHTDKTPDCVIVYKSYWRCKNAKGIEGK